MKCRTALVSDGIRKTLDAMMPRHPDPEMRHVFSLPAFPEFELAESQSDCEIRQVSGPESDSDAIAILPGARSRYDLVRDVKGTHLFRRRKSVAARDSKRPITLAELNRINRQYWGQE